MIPPVVVVVVVVIAIAIVIVIIVVSIMLVTRAEIVQMRQAPLAASMHIMLLTISQIPHLL